MMKGYRPKPAPRPAAKVAQEVPSYASYHQVNMLSITGAVLEFEPGALDKTLLLALERGGDAMDKAKHADILHVARCLQKRLIDEHQSDMQA